MAAVYFDSDDDASDLVAALEAEGYATSLTREGFAGEDDSEDRAWVLLVAPFDERVVEMVAVYGGWLPGDNRLAAEPLPSSEPIELPTGPKRLKD
ncbi:MAG: hypothetical protein JWM93_3848 [Frankiales bacterium]|nr:hypothetical protein [Frankiales bacterium]